MEVFIEKCYESDDYIDNMLDGLLYGADVNEIRKGLLNC